MVQRNPGQDHWIQQKLKEAYRRLTSVTDMGEGEGVTPDKPPATDAAPRQDTGSGGRGRGKFNRRNRGKILK